MSRSRRESTRIRPRLEGCEARIVLDASTSAVAAVADTSTTTTTTTTDTATTATDTSATATTTTTTATKAPTLVFRTSQATLFSQQSQEADITLALRSPQAIKQPVNVHVATSDGSAIANVQYRPVDEVITFQPGQTTKVIAIPIIPGASNPGQLTLNVNATIQDDSASTVGTQVTIADIPDKKGPEIIDADLIVVDKAVKGIQITFNEPMNARTLEKVANYTVWDFSKKPSVGDWVGSILSGGKNDAFAPTPVRIRAVIYDPDSRSVLLVPKRKLVTTGQYDVTSGFRAPKPTVKPRKGGPADTQGNLLGYFHVSVGTPNKANSAGVKAASILSKFPRL